jgi:hyperosmotically inducible protein
MKAIRMMCSMMLLGAAAAGPTMCVAVRASEMDARIEAAAENSYVYQTFLKDDRIRIESTDGIVTLTGTVSEESHKGLAEDTVKNLPGVVSVDNRLEVKLPNPAARSDQWIGAKVKLALLLHRSVSGKTQVFVKDGVVTLKGTAANQAQRELATEYARDVDGVKNVINEMTVAQPASTEPTLSERIDDASITAQVKLALLTHRSTSALRTQVRTENGVVTLRGTAKNQAEKDLVTKLVRDIHGVNDVANAMTIGG